LPAISGSVKNKEREQILRPESRNKNGAEKQQGTPWAGPRRWANQRSEWKKNQHVQEDLSTQDFPVPTCGRLRKTNWKKIPSVAKQKVETLGSREITKGKIRGDVKTDFFHCNLNPKYNWFTKVTVIPLSFDWKLKLVLDSLLNY
jgi:hypothetical protein